MRGAICVLSILLEGATMSGPGASPNQGVRQAKRPEPRSMILADVLALVAGLGIAFPFPTNPGMLPLLPVPL